MPKRVNLIPLVCTQCNAPIKTTAKTIIDTFDLKGNKVVIKSGGPVFICPYCDTEFIAGDAFNAPPGAEAMFENVTSSVIIVGNGNIAGNGNTVINSGSTVRTGAVRGSKGVHITVGDIFD